MYQYQCPQCNNAFTTQTPLHSVRCPYCGHEFSVAFAGGSSNQPSGTSQLFGDNPFSIDASGRSRGVAALLAILIGAFGAHYIYLGKTGAGVVFLLITFFSCFILSPLVQVAAIVQGVLMFTMTDEDFTNKYCNPAVSFPLF